MARPKRTADAADIASTPGSEPVPKKGRPPGPASKKPMGETAAATRSKRVTVEKKDAPKSTVKNPKSKVAKASRISRGAGKAVKDPAEPEEDIIASSSRRSSIVSVEIPRSDINVEEYKELSDHGGSPSYWLMKAEPESRIEKNRDVKFSIDDLAAASAPEGWDGVRNMAARNNMRAMKKGDLAFFYHSNCKVPGIAGIMEIVEEHSADETAFDEDHPYYDPKSKRDSPKWSLVHVAFRQKFPKLVKLKTLQKFSKPGGVLESLQTLKQTRLSVSKVSKTEWNFIMTLVEDEDDTTTAPAKMGEAIATRQKSAPSDAVATATTNEEHHKSNQKGKQS